MQLKDLTKEQAIQIAKLIWDFPELLMSEPDAEFVEADLKYGDYPNHYNAWFYVNWYGKKRKFICDIYENLDCGAAVYEEIFNDKGEFIYNNGLITLPTRHQYQIQKLFRKWNIQPKGKTNEKGKED